MSKSAGGNRRFSRFSPGYEEFIKGPVWKLYREQYFSRHAKVCRICRSPNKVQLHHGVHSQYWVLRDAWMFPLCQDHHQKLTIGFQKRRNMKESLLEYTLLFIASRGNL